ncbi:MAG TPA: hypothetical protein ENN40_07765 [Candidatus Aminicenantes bacterium]|nr:hypothetical protein [Candidatus Aminicenantes bacterium]
MTKKMILISVIVVGLSVFPLLARWHSGKHGCACGTTAEKAVTFMGTVQEVVNSKDGKGRYADGIHLMIAEGEKKHEVHLGPREWLDKQDWKPAKGDVVNVNAYTCTCRGDDALMVKKIQKGDQVLSLRGDDGRPMWNLSRDGGRGKGHRGKSRRGNAGCRGCSGCGARR